MSMSLLQFGGAYGNEPGPVIPPEILLYVDAGVVLDRLLSHSALDGLDKAEWTTLYRILSPISNEIAAAYLQLARVISLRSLVGPVGQRAYGPYLDEIGDQEMGVPRDSNVSARVLVTLTGPPGTLIPQGTTFSCPNPPLQYGMIVGTVLGTDGTGGGIAECLTPGTIGNVPAGAISGIVTPGFAGVSVTNEWAQPLIPGTDIESDEAYRIRLLRYRRDPPNGTNGAQFRTWAEQVPGVGRAQVVRPAQTLEDLSDPRRPTPGTIHIYIVGMDLIKPPLGPLATTALVDSVQQWIAPAPPPVQLLTTAFTIEAAAPLAAWAEMPAAEMRYAGLWTFRPQLALTDGPTDPAQRVTDIAVYNVTDSIDLPASPNQPGVARRAVLAGELSASPPLVPTGLPELTFYWDGTPQNSGVGTAPGKYMQLQIGQQPTDVGTLAIHGAWLVAQFSDPDQYGLADVADRVVVFAAQPIPLTIDVTVQAQPGWSVAAVQNSVQAALETYLRTICFGGAAPPVGGQPDPTANDVLFGVAQAVVIGAAGVAYIRDRSMRVNGDTLDLEIWHGDVATLATLNCTVELATPY